MRLRQTQEAFGACGGCHERESGQEKVMRHQLVQSTDVGAEPTWEGGRKARTRKRDRERKREGARGPREREKEWDQSPRCRTRRVSVTERRPWKSEHPPNVLELVDRPTNTERNKNDRQDLWSGVGGWEKKQYTEKLFLPQALSEKTDAPELGVCVIQVSTANGRFGSVPARGNTVFVR